MTGNGKIEMVYTPEGGAENRMEVFNFKDGGGVSMTMYNTDEVSMTITRQYMYIILSSRHDLVIHVQVHVYLCAQHSKEILFHGVVLTCLRMVLLRPLM